MIDDSGRDKGSLSGTPSTSCYMQGNSGVNHYIVSHAFKCSFRKVNAVKSYLQMQRLKMKDQKLKHIIS